MIQNCEGEGNWFWRGDIMRVSGWEGDYGGNKWTDPGFFNKTNPNLFKTKRGSYITHYVILFGKNDNYLYHFCTKIYKSSIQFLWWKLKIVLYNFSNKNCKIHSSRLWPNSPKSATTEFAWVGHNRISTNSKFSRIKFSWIRLN